MPILQIHSIHNPSLHTSLRQSSSASACRQSDRKTLDFAAGRALSTVGEAAASIPRRQSEHLKLSVVSELDHTRRWRPSFRNSSSYGSLPIYSKEAVGLSHSKCLLGSEWRERLEGFSAGSRSAGHYNMAASAVASPVLYKLDSIPNDIPVGIGASENLRADAKRNDRLVVVGHRGCGKNNVLSIGDVPGTRLSVRENTIRSFNLAASNGADYVEFDVQVTKDGQPVIFHDDVILSEAQSSRIGDLTLEEFLSFGPQKDGKVGKNMSRRQKDGTVKAWSSTVEDSLCTLKDAFESVQSSVGFNIEVKFHDTEETAEHELKRVISAILADVENYAKGRMIYFSSFHPAGAIILRQEQNMYPVYFLTEGGERIHNDPRRNSVEAAIDVCVQNGLQGVVTEVLAILKKPQLASQVKNAGLSLFTYGDMNNVAEALVQQYTLNVDGVIVDCVREIVTASRTLHALLNFVQPDWSQFLHPSSIEIEAK